MINLAFFNIDNFQEGNIHQYKLSRHIQSKLYDTRCFIAQLIVFHYLTAIKLTLCVHVLLPFYFVILRTFLIKKFYFLLSLLFHHFSLQNINSEQIMVKAHSDLYLRNPIYKKKNSKLCLVHNCNILLKFAYLFEKSHRKTQIVFVKNDTFFGASVFSHKCFSLSIIFKLYCSKHSLIFFNREYNLFIIFYLECDPLKPNPLIYEITHCFDEQILLKRCIHESLDNVRFIYGNNDEFFKLARGTNSFILQIWLKKSLFFNQNHYSSNNGIPVAYDSNHQWFLYGVSILEHLSIVSNPRIHLCNVYMMPSTLLQLAVVNLWRDSLLLYVLIMNSYISHFQMTLKVLSLLRIIRNQCLSNFLIVQLHSSTYTNTVCLFISRNVHLILSVNIYICNFKYTIIILFECLQPIFVIPECQIISFFQHRIQIRYINKNETTRYLSSNLYNLKPFAHSFVEQNLAYILLNNKILTCSIMHENHLINVMNHNKGMGCQFCKYDDILNVCNSDQKGTMNENINITDDKKDSAESEVEDENVQNENEDGYEEGNEHDDVQNEQGNTENNNDNDNGDEEDGNDNGDEQGGKDDGDEQGGNDDEEEEEEDENDDDEEDEEDEDDDDDDEDEEDDQDEDADDEEYYKSDSKHKKVKMSIKKNSESNIQRTNQKSIKKKDDQEDSLDGFVVYDEAENNIELKRELEKLNDDFLWQDIQRTTLQREKRESSDSLFASKYKRLRKCKKENEQNEIDYHESSKNHFTDEDYPEIREKLSDSNEDVDEDMKLPKKHKIRKKTTMHYSYHNELNQDDTSESDVEDYTRYGINVKSLEIIKDIFGDIETVMDILGKSKSYQSDEASFQKNAYYDLDKHTLKDGKLRKSFHDTDNVARNSYLPERFFNKYQNRKEKYSEDDIKREANWITRRVTSDLRLDAVDLNPIKLAEEYESKFGKNQTYYIPATTSVFDDIQNKICIFLNFVLNSKLEVPFILGHRSHLISPPINERLAWLIMDLDQEWNRLDSSAESIRKLLNNVTETNSDIIFMKSRLEEFDADYDIEDCKVYMYFFYPKLINKDTHGTKRLITTGDESYRILKRYNLDAAWKPYLLSAENLGSNLMLFKSYIFQGAIKDLNIKDISLNFPPDKQSFPPDVDSQALDDWLSGIISGPFSTTTRVLEAMISSEARQIAINPQVKNIIRQWFWEVASITCIINPEHRTQILPYHRQWAALSARQFSAKDLLNATLPPLCLDNITSYDDYKDHLDQREIQCRKAYAFLDMIVAENAKQAVILVHPLTPLDSFDWNKLKKQNLDSYDSSIEDVEKNTIDAEEFDKETLLFIKNLMGYSYVNSNSCTWSTHVQSKIIERALFHELLPLFRRELRHKLQKKAEAVVGILCYDAMKWRLYQQPYKLDNKNHHVNEDSESYRQQFNCDQISPSPIVEGNNNQTYTFTPNYTHIDTFHDEPLTSPSSELLLNSPIDLPNNLPTRPNTVYSSETDKLLFKEESYHNDDNSCDDNDDQLETLSNHYTVDDSCLIPKICSLVIERLVNGIRVHALNVDRGGIPQNYSCYDRLIIDKNWKSQISFSQKDIISCKESIKSFISEFKPNVIIIGASDILCTRLFNIIESITPPKKIHIMYGSLELPRIYSTSNRVPKEYLNLYKIFGCQALCLARYVQNPCATFLELWSDASRINNILLNFHFHYLQEYLPKDRLETILLHSIQTCVANIGVDINSLISVPHWQSSLQFIPGLGPKKAAFILQRLYNPLQRRNELLSLTNSLDTHIDTSTVSSDLQTSNFTDKTSTSNNPISSLVFLNCASFIKLPYYECIEENHLDPLGCTRLHPIENYSIAYKMAKDALDEMNNTLSQTQYILHVLKNPHILDELDLEEYAIILHNNDQFRRLPCLEFVREELKNPFKDPRYPMQRLIGKRFFFSCTQGYAEEFTPGVECIAKVTDISRNRVILNLQRINITAIPVDVEEYIHEQLQLKNKNRFNHRSKPTIDQFLCMGSLVSCRIQYIDYSKFTAYIVLSKKESELVLYNILKNLSCDSILGDINLDFVKGIIQFHNSSNTIKSTTPIQNQTKSYSALSTRRISHHKFRYTSLSKIYHELKHKPVGEALFIPYETSTDILLLCINICSNPVLIKVVLIHEYEQPHKGELGTVLKIGNDSYSNLNQILNQYVEIIKTNLLEIYQSQKYHQVSSVEELERILLSNRECKASQMLSPSSIEWGICIDEKYPSNQPGIRFYLVTLGSHGHDGQITRIRDCIYVTRNYFKLWTHKEKSFRRLINWWKTEGYFKRKQFINEYNIQKKLKDNEIK